MSLIPAWYQSYSTVPAYKEVPSDSVTTPCDDFVLWHLQGRGKLTLAAPNEESQTDGSIRNNGSMHDHEQQLPQKSTRSYLLDLDFSKAAT